MSPPDADCGICAVHHSGQRIFRNSPFAFLSSVSSVLSVVNTFFRFPIKYLNCYEKIRRRLVVTLKSPPPALRRAAFSRQIGFQEIT